MPKIVLITGATSGIGEATAQRLAADGWNLIITGRRQDRLQQIAIDISKRHDIEILPLSFDVSNLSHVKKNLEHIPKCWQDIDVLINNAGLAVGLNPIHEGEIDDWERMIDTNVKGLLYVTKAIAPYMIAKKRGYIINVGSIAGRETYINGNVYCAAKSAVDALTKGIRMDLLTYGIRVAQIAPGATETEFSTVRFKGDTQRASSVYAGFEPLRPSDVADIIAYMVSCPSHVNIADVLILPAAQASASLFDKKVASK